MPPPGGPPVSGRLTGGVDEFFSRTDSGGTFYPLTDALGTTVALTDSTGALQTQYTYEPFGSATITGPANPNPYQFTGRENDGTGLYYYRARYYSPIYQRFISEDPAGFSGGINFYAYAGNDPVDFADPFGLKPPNGPGPGVPGNAPGSPNRPPGAPNPWGSPGSPSPPGSCQSFYCSPTFWTTAVTLGLAFAAPEFLPLEFAAEAAEGAEAAEAAEAMEAADVAGAEAAGATTEAVPEGAASDYLDTTNPSANVTNITTNITPQQAADTLQANGFTNVTQSGSATIYTNANGDQYIIRPSNTSPSGWAMDYKPGGGPTTLKINFR